MKEIQETKRVETLFERISALIEQGRQRVATAVNIAEVYTKYVIGQYIVEDEQKGYARAEYGKQVLKSVSEKLTERYGKGWGLENLRLIRNFYLVYSSKIQNSVLEIVGKNDKQYLPPTEIVCDADEIDNQCLSNPIFTLSWSHYLILMRIENPDARSFYEIECSQQQWSVRQLSRQVGSSLYERLALSRNKDEVMRLAREGQTVEKPSKSKNDALVELTLPKDANIYATAYQLYLPDKALLQRKLKEWVDEFNEMKGGEG